MDSRIYFHQYRRPRQSNPTYKSSNVQNSMIYFNSGYNTQRNYNKNNGPINKYYNNQTKTDYINQNQRYQKFINNNNLQTSYKSKQIQNYNPIQQQARQQNSKLSNYGQRSLDQRGVYHKQTSKFDIINFQPREYNQDIKQYPWLTVQNKDDVYYRRMNEIYNTGSQNIERNKTNDKPISYVAGKHTYDLQPKFSHNSEQNRPKKFTAKMLNHMDELQHNLA